MSNTITLVPSTRGVHHFRPIVHRTRGSKHGPIVRLISPSDVGELVKPFVFLDHVNVGRDQAPGFGFHPHSGIATLTLTLKGGFSYEDSTGAHGTIEEGGVEWMQAGGGVWHAGRAVGEKIKGFQLWIALPPHLETSEPVSHYVERQLFQTVGPARVVLGELEGVSSVIPAPSSMNFLEVNLEAGEVWRYEPPSDHDVAWIAVHEGRLRTPEDVAVGELAVFEQAAGGAITFEALEPASFVLGSAVKHSHSLVLGPYSVHTNPDALLKGANGIRDVAKQLQQMGKL